MEVGKWKMEVGKWKMEIGNAKWHGTSLPWYMGYIYHGQIGNAVMVFIDVV